ncbi:MAG: M20/M25/M40 family metallo-hydrolase [Candidatus Micrarchaeia archaeon]
MKRVQVTKETPRTRRFSAKLLESEWDSYSKRTGCNIKLLSEMIGIPTDNENSMRNFGKFAALVKREAEKSGFKVKLISYPGKREIVNIVIDCLFKPGAPTVMLLGHYDTVALPGASTELKVEKVRLPDGREVEAFKGLGVSDMKSAICAALAALNELKKSGKAQVNIRLVLCPCEEGDYPYGAYYLFNDYEGRNEIMEKVVINIDGNFGSVWHGCSGMLSQRFQFKNVPFNKFIELLKFFSRTLSEDISSPERDSEYAASSAVPLPKTLEEKHRIGGVVKMFNRALIRKLVVKESTLGDMKMKIEATEPSGVPSCLLFEFAFLNKNAEELYAIKEVLEGIFKKADARFPLEGVEKGYSLKLENNSFKLEVFGKSAHLGSPWLGTNAIDRALSFFEAFQERYEPKGHFEEVMLVFHVRTTPDEKNYPDKLAEEIREKVNVAFKDFRKEDEKDIVRSTAGQLTPLTTETRALYDFLIRKCSEVSNREFGSGVAFARFDTDRLPSCIAFGIGCGGGKSHTTDEFTPVENLKIFKDILVAIASDEKIAELIRTVSR